MRTWILIGIFLGVAIIAFALFIVRLEEGPAPVEHAAIAGAPITDIHITDSYKKGTHTIKGTATVPTACTAFSATAAVNGATTSPAIRVDLSAPVDDGICLERATDVSFSVSVDAGADVPLEVYANGALATTTP